MAKRLRSKTKSNLQSQSFDWRIIFPVVIAFAVLGGYLIWGVFADSFVNCARPADNKLNYCVNDSDESKIVRLYYGAFDRKADKEGLSYWVKQMRLTSSKKKSLQDVANFFVNSSEYKRKFNPQNTQSNSDFVKTVYKNTFDRSPSSKDISYWTNQMSKGKTRAWVLVAITESPEAKRDYQLRVAEGLGFKDQWNNRPAEVRKNYSIVIVAGQSNAVGNESYTQESNAFKDSHPAYSAYPMSFKIYSASDKSSLVNIRTAQLDGNKKQIFGPEIGLARTLYEKGKRDVLIVKVAEGGTPIHKRAGHDWNVASRGENYDDLVRQVKSAYAWVNDKGATYQVDGMVWMQGETDTVYNDGAINYYKNIDNLWTSLKRDLNMQSRPKMVLGKIDLNRHWAVRKSSRNCAQPNPTTCATEIANTSKVQQAQEKFAADKSDVSIVRTSDLPVVPIQQIHYSAAGQLELGRRFAEALMNANN